MARPQCILLHAQPKQSFLTVEGICLLASAISAEQSFASQPEGYCLAVPARFFTPYHTELAPPAGPPKAPKALWAYGGLWAYGQAQVRSCLPSVSSTDRRAPSVGFFCSLNLYFYTTSGSVDKDAVNTAYLRSGVVASGHA